MIVPFHFETPVSSEVALLRDAIDRVVSARVKAYGNENGAYEDYEPAVLALVSLLLVGREIVTPTNPLPAPDRALLDALSTWFIYAMPDANGMIHNLERHSPQADAIRRAVADYRDARGMA